MSKANGYTGLTLTAKGFQITGSSPDQLDEEPEIQKLK